MEKPKFYVSTFTMQELERIKLAVIKKDRDYVMCIDGEEGSGKSVLALQIASILDPNFCLDNVCFNSDTFIERLRKANKFSCIVLDEAFTSANSRSALSEVNKSLIAVATEMRQKNLFVILVIPSFFDLDKYFAIWRCRSLFHTYFKNDGSRGSYVIFPKTAKKMLYLKGKKFYNYSSPPSPFPACRFQEYYPVDEKEYRHKKAEAFRTRIVSGIARRWKQQRDALIKDMFNNLNIPTASFEKILLRWGARPVSQREIQKIVELKGKVSQEELDEDEETNIKE